MRNLITFFLVLSVLTVQGSFAQSTFRLKLSNERPAAGENVTFTYDTAGSPLAGKPNINAVACYLDGKDYPAADVALQPDGKFLKGTLVIPPMAKAFIIKISSNEDMDNNNEKGYIYLIYKDGKPIEGAYASNAYILSSGIGKPLAQIKFDENEGLRLYQKEFENYPNNTKDQQNYLFLLANSKNAVNRTVAIKKATELAKSGNEDNMMQASNLYEALKMTSSADALKAVTKSKFPGGKLDQNDASRAFWQENDLTKKAAMYDTYVKKYPESNEKHTTQDGFRAELASAYLMNGDMVNYKKMESQLKDKTNMAYSLNETAWQWALKGEHLDEALQLSKQAIELTAQKMNSGNIPYRSASEVKETMQYTYDNHSDTYAYILYKLGKYDEALKIQQVVMENEKQPKADFREHYALYLKASKNYDKASQVIEDAIKDGKSNATMNASLKEIYIIQKGSDKGYDTYFVPLKKIADQNARMALAKEMINQPAPNFALKDFDGKRVSLASLKGKVVVIDFWATWCGPCKASMPGMQMAVNKFKNDPNVKFLFVDVWENGTNYLPAVKKFIADKKYTFHVLMDEKDEDGRQSKMANAYRVGDGGIPTKFIIDGKGSIRFKKIGFEEGEGALVEEVSTMIDMAAHPEKISSTESPVNKKAEGK